MIGFNKLENEGVEGNRVSLKAFSSVIGKDIPLYEETINKRGNFINFGDNNDLPDYYVSLLDRSPKHNAIVHQKASMTSGNGWKKADLSNECLMFLQNSAGDYDLDELAARVGYDLEVYGAFLLNIIWSKDRERIAAINYVNPQTMRIEAPSKHSIRENYYLSADWQNLQIPENEPKKHWGFDLTDRKEASQLLYCKTYQAGKYFYGVPEYISGARWIEMEFEISQFHLSNIKNGFAPSMFINFPTGIPTDEEMVYNDRKLMKELSGPMGGGRPFITYSEDKDSAPIITPIETNSNDSKFIELNEIITEGILGAHRVSDPALFGLNKPAEGINLSQTHILDSLEMFRSQYIKPKQRFIEKCFNRLARINGLTDKLQLAQYELNFAKMDLAIGDVLNILGAQLPDEVKRNMLVLNGYSEEDALKLVPEKINGI